MSQHHFVIEYDSKTSDWSWDIETEMAVFPNGAVYDEGEWVRPSHTPEITLIDNDISDTVGSIIHRLGKEGTGIKWG
jgi:hypothetical protein